MMIEMSKSFFLFWIMNSGWTVYQRWAKSTRKFYQPSLWNTEKKCMHRPSYSTAKGATSTTMKGTTMPRRHRPRRRRWIGRRRSILVRRYRTGVDSAGNAVPFPWTSRCWRRRVRMRPPFTSFPIRRCRRCHLAVTGTTMCWRTATLVAGIHNSIHNKDFVIDFESISIIYLWF